MPWVCLYDLTLRSNLPIVFYCWKTWLLPQYLLRFQVKNLNLISRWWGVCSHPNLYAYCLSLVISLGSALVLLVWSRSENDRRICQNMILLQRSLGEYHLWHRSPLDQEVYSLLCLGGSNFILHCCIYSTLNISLLFGAGFSSTKNMESGILV
jgi:hypothetical protein